MANFAKLPSDCAANFNKKFNVHFKSINFMSENISLTTKFINNTLKLKNIIIPYCFQELEFMRFLVNKQYIFSARSKKQLLKFQLYLTWFPPAEAFVSETPCIFDFNIL